MSRGTLMDAVQRLLERTYAMEPPLASLDRFVIGDRGYRLLYGAAVELNAPYVAEMARREMLSRYGEETYTAGFQVVTSLDSRLQKSANYALRNGLLEFTRRRGFRGPITTIELPPELPGLEIAEWPAETLEVLDQYAPGGLSVALVTKVNDNDTVDIVFRDPYPDQLSEELLAEAGVTPRQHAGAASSETADAGPGEPE